LLFQELPPGLLIALGRLLKGATDILPRLGGFGGHGCASPGAISYVIQEKLSDP
jgi:hypothetical protein